MCKLIKKKLVNIIKDFYLKWGSYKISKTVSFSFSISNLLLLVIHYFIIIVIIINY